MSFRFTPIKAAHVLGALFRARFSDYPRLRRHCCRTAHHVCGCAEGDYGHAGPKYSRKSP